MLASYLLIVFIALSRLIPHPAGLTAIGALGLFSGAYMHHRWSWAVPVSALLIGDAIIGFYNPIIMLTVYIGFAISAVVGKLILGKKSSLNRIGVAIFVAALIFFILSNTASWWVFYPHTIEGLLLCYINGLSYFGVGILGDVFYCTILFGTYQGLQRYYSNKQCVRA